MEDILYLTHRIPYPPNKGDKIRSFNILKYLSAHYRVHLGTFVDDVNDKKYIDKLDDYVVDKKVIEINPFSRRLASLRGLLNGAAFSNEFYRSPALHGWVENKIQTTTINKAVLFSSPMAQFLQNDQGRSVHRVMDFVDVDSEKWLQYANNHKFLMKLLYRREGMKLRQFERQVAGEFEASLFVSEQEAALFKKIATEQRHKIHAMLNGVDTNYFDPDKVADVPYPEQQKVISFTGAMDYWANVEAVQWFAREVFPKVLVKHPGAAFYIVGAKPSEAVKALGKHPNIFVVGAVYDIRPFIKYANVNVAPLRIARGIQNKVLEAMAMKKYIVATPDAMEGIGNLSSAGVQVTADPDLFAEKVNCGLASEQIPTLDTCRDAVLKHFSWSSHLSKINELLGNQPVKSSPAV